MAVYKTNIAGVDIAYLRQGSGVPLVLVHGYPLDHSIWNDVIPLLKADFDMIIPDLRGFGESQVMEADHSIIDYASDLAGLLDRLRLRKAYIAGHSMGGYVALGFAREYPARVSGLALISSQVLADSPQGKANRYATAKQVLEQGVGSVAEGMTPKLSSDQRVQEFVRPLISQQKPLAIYCALQAMADRPDSTDAFKTFTFPVVIVHGQADTLIPVERGREMKAALPSAHYVELPAVGHMPMMEDPRAVAEALRAFLGVRPKTVKILNS